jgi:thiamine-monophosphate kinase
MDQRDPAVTVFLSYAGSEREQALQVRNAMEERGIRVRMDSNFEAGQSVLVNIGASIINSRVVVALISTEYLDRKFTEIEVSAAITSEGGRLLPVVLGDVPQPRTTQGVNLWTVLGGRSFFQLAMTRESLDGLAAEIRRVDAGGQVPARREHSGEQQDRLPLAVIYEWENGQVIDDVVRQCASRGWRVAQIVGAGVPLDLSDSAPRADIGILWTQAAQASPDVAAALLNAAATRHDVIYLVQPGSPSPPVGATVVELQPASPPTSLSRTERPSDRWVLDRTLLRARLEESLRLNSEVPFHLLGDKFCAGRESAEAAAEVYQTAVRRFRSRDEERLAAVLAYAAVCRFRGDWNQAAELLATELLPVLPSNEPYPPTALAVRAERLSLDFELGRVTETAAATATEILAQALAAGEWALIIAAHRHLGMIIGEQGQYSRARDHLDRACHYSEDLLDTELLAERIPSHAARVALRADCLRELANVEWRADEPQLASLHLRQAARELQLILSSPAADYLLSVVEFQKARVDYSMDHDYESARTIMQASYRNLQRYDNPIRLATVLEALAQLEMNFARRRGDTSVSLRSTLEKILRVRSQRGHYYTISRTKKLLGDLEFSLGNYQEAKDQYEDAGDEFNRLNKLPELADTLRARSRCHLRLDELDDAINNLDNALGVLHEPDHHLTRAEIRSEIARIRHRRLALSQVGDDTEMTEVGEFTVHDWIARGLVRESGVEAAGVVLGVGDDGAVLRLPADEDLVVTTDTVPADLLAEDSAEAADYAARFAIVSTLADILSMGAEPTAVLLNLHLRRATAAAWTRTLLRSAAQEAASYGAVVVGGDLRERAHKALTVTAIGRVRRGRELTRDGARVGDLVAVTLSSSRDRESSGLGSRWAHELASHLSRDEAALIDPIIADDARFTDLGLPHETMHSVVQAGLATAAIDTSDGILACAQLIGDAAGVGIELFPNAIGDLINKDVAQLARSLGIAPFLFALNAGYDWEIVLTVPKARRDDLEALGGASPGSSYPRLAVIGQVVERETWARDGVHLRLAGGPVLLPFFTGEKFVPSQSLLWPEWLEFARESSRLLPPEASGTDSS